MEPSGMANGGGCVPRVPPVDFEFGPLWPGGASRRIFCMLGDESLMFRPYQSLPECHQRHADRMRFDILPWASAFIALSEGDDTVILDEHQRTFPQGIAWLMERAHAAGLGASRRIVYASPERAYSEARRLLEPRHPEGACSSSGALLCTVAHTYPLCETFGGQEFLVRAQEAASKMTLARWASEGLVPSPRSIVVSKGQVDRGIVEKELHFPSREIILKADGLGGGLNVRRVRSWEELGRFLDPYEDGTPILAQSAIEKSRAEEFTVEALLRPSGVEIIDVRKGLVIDDGWCGNRYGRSVRLPEHARAAALATFEQVRRLGLVSERGYICGLNLFSCDGQSYVFDVNPRWNGGLPPKLLFRKLGLGEPEGLAFMDVIAAEDFGSYTSFVEGHFGLAAGENGFALFPLGLGPTSDPRELLVWTFVSGDFQRFRECLERTTGGQTPFGLVDRIAEHLRQVP